MWGLVSRVVRATVLTGSDVMVDGRGDTKQPLGRIMEDISAAYKKQWPQTSQQYTYVAPTADAK
jgi:hypothetical protein